MDYLINQRKLEESDIDKFRIGFTSYPKLEITSDPDYATICEETKGPFGPPNSLFRLKKKILLPLENSAGLVNGLVTRSIEKDTKYRYCQYLLKESKDIGAFFGLRQAYPSILNTGIVFVTEGAFDCISLSKVYPNTVSTLTSYINSEQMWFLDMIADYIVIVFDPDKAGREGSEKVFFENRSSSKKLINREIGHKDLNDILKEKGFNDFKKIVEKSLSTVKNFKIR
jgi:DNA primase